MYRCSLLQHISAWVNLRPHLVMCIYTYFKYFCFLKKKTRRNTYTTHIPVMVRTGRLTGSIIHTDIFQHLSSFSSPASRARASQVVLTFTWVRLTYASIHFLEDVGWWMGQWQDRCVLSVGEGEKKCSVRWIHLLIGISGLCNLSVIIHQWSQQFNVERWAGRTLHISCFKKTKRNSSFFSVCNSIYSFWYPSATITKKPFTNSSNAIFFFCSPSCF